MARRDESGIQNDADVNDYTSDQKEAIDRYVDHGHRWRHGGVSHFNSSLHLEHLREIITHTPSNIT